MTALIEPSRPMEPRPGLHEEARRLGAAPPSAIHVDVIRSPDGFAAFAPEWRSLAVAAGNLFVTPEWAGAWSAVYGDRFRPSVHVAHREGRVVGVLPLMVGPDGGLRFLGDGAGDVFAPLVRSDDADRVSVLERLGASAAAEDHRYLVLANVERGADWRAHRPSRRGERSIFHRSSHLPYIETDGEGWNGFLSTRSANFRSQLKRKRATLEGSGPVTFRCVENPATLDQDLSTFFALHDRRWVDRGGSSSATADVRAFLRLVAASALRQDWLRLWFLDVGGRPAASWLGWRIGSRTFYYLAGFDETFSRGSPGFVLLAHTVREAFSEGALEYDFGLGDEVYKERFATSAREVETELVAPRWSVAYLGASADRAARRAVRTLPEWIHRRLRGVGRDAARTSPLGRFR